MTTAQLIQKTNSRLENWYKNAKLDYNVIGKATARIEDEEFIIDYTENGISKKWSTYFHIEYLGFGEDYFFNVWAEQAE